MQRVELDVDPAGLPAGTLNAVVRFTAGTEQAEVNVQVRSSAQAEQATVIVAAAYEDENGEWQVGGGAELAPSSGYAYVFESVPGPMFVLAGVDEDGDGEFFEPGERVGFYKSLDAPEQVVVVAGRRVTGVDFSLFPLAAVGAEELQVGIACATDGECPTGECVTGWPGGYCTRECSTADCPTGTLCVEFDSGFYCMDPCPNPGWGQDTCRSGYSCTDDGLGGGVCVP
jgi:serine protease